MQTHMYTAKLDWVVNMCSLDVVTYYSITVGHHLIIQLKVFYFHIFSGIFNYFLQVSSEDNHSLITVKSFNNHHILFLFGRRFSTVTDMI